MKRIYALLLSLILLLGISACGARGEKKEFTSFLPPKSATVHEDIQVDETNHITIVDTQTIVPNPDKPDEKILIVTYDWKNDSEKQKITYGSFLITAKQDGVSLKPDLKHVEDKFKLVRPVEGGETLQGIQQGFVLLSDGEVTLSIKGNMYAVFVDGVPQNSYPVEVSVAVN
jgi:predicted component of type VI protein secretion system